MTIYTLADKNIRKTWILMFLFMILVGGFGYIFGYQKGAYGLLFIVLLYAVLMNISSFWYSDKIILKINRAHAIEMKDNPELYRLVENLCITAGLPLPKIYIIKDQAPNAFSTGRDPKHGAIAVTRGLLNILNRSELEGVLSHELSHIGNRDTLFYTVLTMLVGFFVLLSDIFWRSGLFLFGGKRKKGFPGLGLIGLLLLIFAPIVGTLIKLAVSRSREYLADANGVLLTRYPEGLIGALEKINANYSPLKRANKATSHLFIFDPFKPQRGINLWFHNLFSTHPPIEERIKALKESM